MCRNWRVVWLPAAWPSRASQVTWHLINVIQDLNLWCSGGTGDKKGKGSEVVMSWDTGKQRSGAVWAVLYQMRSERVTRWDPSQPAARSCESCLLRCNRKLPPVFQRGGESQDYIKIICGCFPEGGLLWDNSGWKEASLGGCCWRVGKRWGDSDQGVEMREEDRMPCGGACTGQVWWWGSGGREDDAKDHLCAQQQRELRQGDLWGLKK